MATETLKVIDICLQPEYYNHTCRCMIPKMWFAVVELNGERLPKWCGESPTAIIEELVKEFPNAKRTMSKVASLLVEGFTLIAKN